MIPLLATLALTIINPNPVTYDDAYLADRVCFVGVYEAAIAGERDTVPVVDTFQVLDDWSAVNVGSTSWTVSPCVPTACPDGMVLVSGNVCAHTDPFTAVPDHTHTAAAVGRQVTAGTFEANQTR